MELAGGMECAGQIESSLVQCGSLVEVGRPAQGFFVATASSWVFRVRSSADTQCRSGKGGRSRKGGQLPQPHPVIVRTFWPLKQADCARSPGYAVAIS